MTDFQEVYDLYFRDIYRYALSLCHDPHKAEEITQETFYKALSGINEFNGKCKVSVWLCQIARNTYISMYRKDRFLDYGTETDTLVSTTDLEESYAEKETVYAIRKVLHALEEPYKEVFSMRTYGQLSFRQIAQLFGKTESWARVTYHRAKLKIKEELE